MEETTGAKQIDDYLRDALNIAYVELTSEHTKNKITLAEAKKYVQARLKTVGSYPNSPDPSAFPFTEPPGTQIE